MTGEVVCGRCSSTVHSQSVGRSVGRLVGWSVEHTIQFNALRPARLFGSLVQVEGQ